MILDGLDGRIARLTRSESAFGGQYDSLADMVSFGVAPALTGYLWAADELGRIGVAAAFLFTAAVALRLARFNTQAGNHDRRYFQGLPSPAGAAVIASLIWLAESMPFLEGSLRAPLTALLLVLIAGLMVSRLRYRSFKDFDLSGRVPFLIVAVVVLGAGLLFSAPRTTALAVSAAYLVSGPLGTLQARLRLRRERRRLSPP
jgi:CDP-diacylglycerol---serine O-phosphatidyltransferase